MTHALGMTKVKEAATARAQTPRMARLPSPAMLMRAPHRLLFFIGASNLLLAPLVQPKTSLAHQLNALLNALLRLLIPSLIKSSLLSRELQLF